MNGHHKLKVNALGIRFSRELKKYHKSSEAEIYDSSTGRRIVTIHSYYKRNVPTTEFLRYSLFSEA